MNLTKWMKRSSRTIANCRVFDVREDSCVSEPGGKEATFFVIENPDWVNVIPVTESGQVVLIEQFRQGVGEFTLEIPGGLVDQDEEPAVAAGRELTEETGYTSSQIVYLGKSSPNPALQGNTIFHYAALNCVADGETAFDEHEDIRTSEVPLDDIPKLIADERITHSLVHAGFYRFDEYLRNERLRYES